MRGIIMRYAVIIEWADTNYSAYVPDLPGCISTGRTVEEVIRNIQEALALHLEGMRADGDPIPEPKTFATMIVVDRPGASVAPAFEGVP
jgi:predicted RNase H-like HicB family nuclease